MEARAQAKGRAVNVETIARPVTAPKTSKIPPGHWRCKWTRPAKPPAGFYYAFPVSALAVIYPGTIILDACTWISIPRFLTRERADEDGFRHQDITTRYVEAVYFPGEAP